MSPRKPAAEEPFVLCAMLSLVGATAWLCLRPALLRQFFYSAETLALTHLVTLGFASSIIQGVTQRLMPRALGVGPRSTKLSWAQCIVYLLGAAGMVVHFALAGTVGRAWAAATVLLAALLFAWNHSGVFAAAWRGGWTARWAAASLAHFVLAALLGASFAMLRAYGVGASLWGAPLLERLGAHLVIALLGWIGGAIFGWQLKFLPATRASGPVEAARFALLQGGLLALAGCLLAGLERAAGWCSLPIAAAIALRSGAAITRMGRNWPGLWETVAHGLLLALGGLGVALAFGYPRGDDSIDLRYSLALVLAYVALFGWVTLTVMGTSWKLFSLWVWEERFQPEKGSRPIPPVYRLPSKLLRDASGACLTLGVLGVAACIVADARLPLRIALGLQLLGTLLFLANFIRIARWELLRLEYRG